MAQQTKNGFGPVDIVINNAGLVQGKSFLESDDNMSSKIMVVNAECNMWILKEFLPDMVKNNEGHVVAIASLAGIGGVCGLTDYCASKFAQYGFHEALRVEMKSMKKDITVTTICPFFINTGMFAGTQMSYIAPLLKDKYVAQRIVSAILQSEEEVVIPWRFNWLVRLSRLILTSSAMDKLNQITGGFDCMATFKGRGEKNALHQVQVKKNLEDN